MAIFHAAVAAVDPFALVRDSLDLSGSHLRAGDHELALTDNSRVFVIGAGKATPQMARAAESVLGNRLSGGSINTKHDHAVPLDHIQTVECSHPIPDEDGVRGVHQMLALLEELTPDDVIVCLLSGGGSALMPAPAAGLSLADKGQTTAALLACGATIHEINAIRKHLSAIKGGQLARQAMPARVVSLLMSDVIGDPIDIIASGPTAPDPSTFADCLALLAAYGIADQIPALARQHLEAGARGLRNETPKTGDPAFQHTTNVVIGNNALALTAASAEASRRGYQPMVLSSCIAGETRHIASMHAAIAQEIAATGQPLPSPACLISGGETTVTIKGNGKGGRNQEFVLAAAIDLADSDGITVLSCGTDGTDGPTDAAGAIADGTTVARACATGHTAADSLARNDAYPFFQSLDDLVISGPTGTNVMDLRLLLVA